MRIKETIYKSEGLRWNDPALGIDRGIDAGAAILSDKDREQPPWRQRLDHILTPNLRGRLS